MIPQRKERRYWTDARGQRGDALTVMELFSLEPDDPPRPITGPAFNQNVVGPLSLSRANRSLGLACGGVAMRRTSAARHDPPCDRAATFNLSAPLSRAAAFAQCLERQFSDSAPHLKRHSSLPVACAATDSERRFAYEQEVVPWSRNE